MQSITQQINELYMVLIFCCACMLFWLTFL